MESIPATRVAPILTLLLCLTWGVSLKSAILYSESFESLPLGPEWSLVNSGTGRARVTSEFGPSDGTQHLVLDDSVSDAVAAPAEAILRINLNNYQNLTLQYRAKSIGNEPDWIGGTPTTGQATYDGIAISTNDGETWRAIGTLRDLAVEWTTNQISLDGYLFQSRPRLMPDVLIRFSEYDNASAPIDGLAIDAIEIAGEPAQRFVIELPQSVREGSGSQTGYVMLAFPATEPTEVQLSSSSPEDLALPASITIPAGQSVASFDFVIRDDRLVNLLRLVTINGSIRGKTVSFAFVTILDDEDLSIRLQVPEVLSENEEEASMGHVLLDRPADVPLEVRLYWDAPDQITAPFSVDIPAGTTDVTFLMRATNDTEIEGPRVVTLTAQIPGTTAATATVRLDDNEARTIQWATASPLVEGTTNEIILALSGFLSEPRTVHLAIRTPEFIAAPESVVIPAYVSVIHVPVTCIDNTRRDGTRLARIEISADGFESISATFSIVDNELAALTIRSSSDFVLPGDNAIGIEVKAFDVEGNPSLLNRLEAAMEFVSEAGEVLPASPGSIELIDGVWSGSVQYPESPQARLKLRVKGTADVVAETAYFEPVRILPFAAGDLIWDARRERIYASLRASGNGAEANHVVAIDPATGQILARVPVLSDPLHMAITSGGEYLYVALDGTAKIARIDLETFTVNLSFPVGASPDFGFLFAAELQTVKGQPDRLVVSRRRRDPFAQLDGVVLFDGGVAKVPQTPILADRMEPTSDPSTFLIYNSQFIGLELRLLHLSESGVAEETGPGIPFGRCCAQLRVDGDRAFDGNGSILDIPTRTTLGHFAGQGAVCPDRAANRVFFIEPPNGSQQSSQLRVFDATTQMGIDHVSLPEFQGAAAGPIRWGKSGLAFRSEDSIVILQAPSLIPAEPPADLQVNVTASEPEIRPGLPLVFTIELSNLGPNPVAQATVHVRFTNIQRIQRVEANQGTVSLSEEEVRLSSLALTAGTTLTFRVHTMPQEGSTASCEAHVFSPALDPIPENDSQKAFVSLGHRSTADSVTFLHIAGIDLVHDTVDDTLLIAGITRDSGDASLASSVIRMNPINGRITQAIPLNTQPTLLALSSNGRYLYAGLQDLPAVQRIDLTRGRPDLRIPLGGDASGRPTFAGDIDVLPGDGKSIIVSLSDQATLSGAAVFREAVRLPQDTLGFNQLRFIEPTATAGLYVELGNSFERDVLRKLQVDESGISAVGPPVTIGGGNTTRFASDADWMLSSSGNLIQGSSLQWLVRLPTQGLPLVDAANRRAYLLNDGFLYAYDTVSFSEVGRLDLHTQVFTPLAVRMVRWGLDGIAILIERQGLVLVRWSEAIAPDRDADQDGLPDRWEAQHFATLAATPDGDDDGDGFSNREEFERGTSPVIAETAMPQILALHSTGNGRMLRYDRLKSGETQSYEIQQSPDLTHWTPAQGGAETVVSTHTNGGLTRETVQWTQGADSSGPRFFRIRWSP